MMTSSESLSKPPIAFLAFSLLLCILPFLGYLAPRSLAFAPLVLLLISGLALKTSQKPLGPPNLIFLSISLGIVFLAFISSFWALNSDFALERTIKISVILIPTAFLFSWMQNIKFSEIPSLSKGFPIAVLITGGLLAFDVITRSGLFYYLHETAPDPGNMSDLNRSVLSFIFFAALALYALKSQWQDKISKLLCLGICAILAVILFKTHSQSAHLAVILMVIGYCAPTHHPAFLRAMMAVLIIGIFGAPWIAQALYTYCASMVEPESWLSKGYAADRMEIWDFIARKALENPLYGFGIEATRHIEAFDTAQMYTPHNHVLHPHNFILQLWIEFGVLGALTVAVVTTAILMKIEHSDLNRRLSFAFFAALFIIAAITYGIWQGWWLGFLVLMAAMVNLFSRASK